MVYKTILASFCLVSQIYIVTSKSDLQPNELATIFQVVEFQETIIIDCSNQTLSKIMSVTLTKLQAKKGYGSVFVTHKALVSNLEELLDKNNIALLAENILEFDNCLKLLKKSSSDKSIGLLKPSLAIIYHTNYQDFFSYYTSPNSSLLINVHQQVYFLLPEDSLSLQEIYSINNVTVTRKLGNFDESLRFKANFHLVRNQDDSSISHIPLKEVLKNFAIRRSDFQGLHWKMLQISWKSCWRTKQTY